MSGEGNEQLVEAMAQLLIQENAAKNFLQASEHEINILIPFNLSTQGIYFAEGSGEELERRTALALMDALARGDELALAEGCIALENDKKTWDRDRLSALMEECVLLCRDALLAGAGAEEEADPQRREEAGQLSRVLSPRALMEAIALFQRLRTACGFYVGGGHLAGWLCAGLAALRSK